MKMCLGQETSLVWSIEHVITFPMTNHVEYTMWSLLFEAPSMGIVQQQ